MPPKRNPRIRPAGAPQFKLELPAPEQSALNAPLQEKGCKPDHLFIELDASLVSPAMMVANEGNFPRGSPNANGADPFGTAAAASGQQQNDARNAVAGPRRFFKVDDSNLYVFMGDQTQAPAFDMRDPSGSADDLISIADAQNSPGLGPQVAQSSMEVNDNIKFEELEIMNHIGTGQQGSVFSAKHKGVTYAVKKISIQDAFNTTHAVERQARKAAVVRELTMVAQRANRSEYCVALHNAYFKKQELLILMEMMSISLEDFVKDISRMPYAKVKQIMQKSFGNSIAGTTVATVSTTLEFPPPKNLTCETMTPTPELIVSLIAHDVLNGLMHLHERLRVVHTDLKPGNILLSQNRLTFKIADFGCSLELDPAGKVPFTGVNLGTKLYMSPERALGIYGGQGDAFDTKSDIWSLGIMLMELAGGCHPCESIREDFWNFGERLRMSEMVRPLSCSSLMYDFLAKCLQTCPTKRLTARELLGHDFIKKYSKISRKNLNRFVAAIEHEAPQYWKKVQRDELRLHWECATKTKDTNYVRKAQKKWQGFNKGKGIGVTSVPKVDDKDSFPSL